MFLYLPRMNNWLYLKATTSISLNLRLVWHSFSCVFLLCFTVSYSIFLCFLTVLLTFSVLKRNKSVNNIIRIMNNKKKEKNPSAGNKKNFSRKRKRKWNGVIANKVKSAKAPCLSSASERKLSHSNTNVNDATKNDFFFLMYFPIFENIIGQLACPECLSTTIEVLNNESNRKGFTSCFSVKCSSCTWKNTFYTSPEVKKTNKKQGRNMYELNIRSVIAFREIGCGFTPMKTFASVITSY